MSQLPVEHGTKAGLVDDEVADPEVAVDYGIPTARRAVGVEPLEGNLERGAGFAEEVEAGAEPTQCVDRYEPGHSDRVDRMDRGQSPPALPGEHAAGRGQGVLADNAGAESLAVNVSGNPAGANERCSRRRVGHHHWHWHAASSGGGEQGIFGCQRRTPHG